MNKRLYRSRRNFMIGGVCAGLGEYLRIDSLIIRIFFTLWLVLGNFGGMAYLILWVLMPPEQLQDEYFRLEDMGVRFGLIAREIRDVFRSPNPKLVTFVGIWLIGMGVVHIFREFTWSWFGWWNPALVWPAILVIAGIFIIFRAINNQRS
jgi:phage shock protein PspC (stress-responsive transcriptional regulator)